MANEKELFASLEAKYRLPQGYLDRLYEIESGRGTNLRSKTSSAKGPFQFTDRTAKAVGLENPDDLAASADAAARLAVQNRTVLQQNGVENPDGKMLYLAHQQGAGGALKLLKAGDEPADKAVGAKAVTNNGGDKGDTAKGFVEQIFGKYEGANPDTVQPYSALKTSEPLDQKAPDTLSVLEGPSDIAPVEPSTKKSALAINLLSSAAQNLQPRTAPLLDIPNISKPRMEFAKGGLASLKKSDPPVREEASSPQERLTKRLNFVPPGMPKGNPKTGMLFPPSIILQSMQAQGISPEGATQALHIIGAAAKAGKIKIIQLGNTVFVVTPKPDKSADILINTVEPRMLPVRLKGLTNTLKQLGFRKMTTLVKPSEDQQAEVLLKDAGIKHKKVVTQVSLQKGQTEKAFRYEVEV